MTKRDPKHSKGDCTCLWELSALPSVGTRHGKNVADSR